MHNVFLSTFLFFFLACSNKGKDPNIKNNLYDSTIKEIPKYKNGEVIYSYVASAKTAAKLNLDSLENGYDSIQIRIWYGFAKSDTGQIFIIKYNSGKWSASGVFFKYLFDPRAYKGYVSDTFTTIAYHPSSWNNFVNKLFELKVTSLEDMDSIKGYKDVDGIHPDGCCVEVATKNKYRFYGYSYPDYYRKQYWQADNMMKIIELIENEFGYKPIRKHK